MQARNLILWFVTSLILMVGWAALLQRWYPPPKREPRVALPAPPLWSAVPGELEALMAHAPGDVLGRAGSLAANLAVANWSAAEPAQEAKAPAKPPDKAPAANAGAANAGLQEPAAQAVVAAKHEETILGSKAPDSPYNIQVVFTTEGGGIKSLVLNKFPEADSLGRPAGNPPPPMTLIPPDAPPSNLLFHYDKPETPDRPRALLGERDWKLESVKNGPNDATQSVTFSTRLSTLDVTIKKTFTLSPGTYHIGLAVSLERGKDAKKPLPFRYQLSGAHGLPIEGEWYTTIFRNAMIGLEDKHRRIWRDFAPSQQIGFQEGGPEVRKAEDKIVRYAAVANQYFAAVIVVDDHQPQAVDQDFIAWARATDEGMINPAKPQLNDITVRTVSELLTLEPGKPVVHQYLLYHGPVKVRLLGFFSRTMAVDPALVQRYETTLGLYSLTDIGKFGWWSDLIIFCTNLMHGLLYFLHTYIMPWSYGLCIIMLTILVRGAMVYFSRKQAISSANMQAKMAELQPEMKKLEEKYKDDPTRLRQEKIDLQMKRGINPAAALGSCWMVIAQMPIFLGLYYALQESIQFRLARFLWMPNLAAPDMLFWWDWNVPVWGLIPAYLGPYFNLLPIIAVTLMMFQQKMLTPPPQDEQQEMQQKVMKWMTVFIGVMFYKVASGLCLYFIASSAWGLAERKLFIPKPGARPAPPSGGPPGKPARKKKPGPSGTNGTISKVKGFWEQVLEEARKK
jgi:YidC/Oxa1 family membrane protein insertase